MSQMTETDQWAALVAHAAEPRATLRELLEDEDRVARLTRSLPGLVVDVSRTHLTGQTVELLHDLARERGVVERLRATQAGEHVNTTEDRPALHTALRRSADDTLVVDGTDVVEQVHTELDEALQLATEIRDGDWLGATGEQVRTLVNVGIGGSDLGPRMLHHALADHVTTGIDVRFVSNVDPDAVHDVMAACDPATTLVVVVSKSFSTTETLTNARTLRRWVVDALGEDAVSSHFLAVSTNADRVEDFGIDTERMVGFWDWVGGRYSVSSAVGLSLMVALGASGFHALLAGMAAVDEHARTADLEDNVPALLALLRVWHGNLLGHATHAVLPYSERLALLPAYLQQLDMESLGKRVTLDGEEVAHDTGVILWGQPGTDGQHAFFQLLHQGTRVVPVDLVGVLRPHNDHADHHDQLVANMVAQAQALAIGKTADEVRDEGTDEGLVAHRTFPGDRPSTVITMDELTPATIGALVALYEQVIAALGALWGINAYDQWGVELGKQLASDLLDALVAESPPAPDADHDAATAALLARARTARARPT